MFSLKNLLMFNTVSPSLPILPPLVRIKCPMKVLLCGTPKLSRGSCEHSCYLDCFMTNIPEKLNIPQMIIKREPQNMLADSALIDISQYYKTHKLKEGPALEVNLTHTDAKIFYKHMLMARKIHTILKKYQLPCSTITNCRNQGFQEFLVGREAITIGIRAAMRYDDTLISTKRTFGSVDYLETLAELTASVVSPRRVRWKRGKITHNIRQLEFFGINDNGASQVPIGNGLAFARKYKNQTGTCMTYYGDEASNQGQLFESFNLAALWKLPCVFICDNNGTALGVSANTDYYKCCNYLPGIWINGMHFLAVYNGIKFAIEYAEKYGPILLEINIERADTFNNIDMNKDLVVTQGSNQLKPADPLNYFKELCFENTLLDERVCNKIENSVEAEVKKVIDKRLTRKTTIKRVGNANFYIGCLESKILNEQYFNYKYAERHK